MQISRSILISLAVGAVFVLPMEPVGLYGAEDAAPMHWSGDKTIWDRGGSRLELIGHAAVHQPGESITADYITFDKETRTLDAKGNCTYIATDITIYSDEMHFNMDTRTGTIIGGRVSGDRFSLTGERINKLGQGRFQTHRGDYSTCWDCPQSWTFQGNDVDMEFEGYAYMSGVTARIKDVPVFWLPYLIVPLKTKRQTGFLLPKIKFMTEGVRFTLPFFWAINRSSDMLFGLGYWGGFGPRFEWEGRYKLADRSEGKADFYYVKDPAFQSFLHEENATKGRGLRETPHRWAFNLEQKQEMSFGIDQKLKLVEISDNFYPRRVGDVPGGEDAMIASSLSFSRATSEFSSYVSARRYRNLLNSNPQEFDPKTVQVYPTMVVTTNDRFLFDSPIAAGLTLGATNFTRTGGAFDRDPVNAPFNLAGPDLGKDPIRKATRAVITPSLYTTLRPMDMFSVVPSFEYRSFFYSFHNAIPNLWRSYLLFRSDFSTQIERIYDTSDLAVPRVKHLIRPFFTFNLIPYIQEPDTAHPFLGQIDYARQNTFSGYQFDDYDIVPIDSTRGYNDYFTPVGKSLSYGFTTQLIRRRGSVESTSASYQKTVELKAAQTINFREFRRPVGDREPLSQLSAGLRLNFDQWNGSADYSYFPYGKISPTENRNAYTLGFSYVFERGIRYKILNFDRSLGLGYAYRMTGSPTKNLVMSLNYSISDYVLPSMAVSYSFVDPGKLLGLSLGIKFQSPSRCWKLEIVYSLKPCEVIRPGETGYCGGLDPNLNLNLTGSGFGGVTDVVSQVVQQ